MKEVGEEESITSKYCGTLNPAIFLTHRFYLLHKRMVAGLGNTVLQLVELASYPLHQHRTKLLPKSEFAWFSDTTKNSSNLRQKHMLFR